MAVAMAVMGFFVYDAIRDKSVKAGDQAPNFEIHGLDGRLISRDSLAGKVVLLNIWASWCGPCITETPVLEALHRQFGSQGFVIVGISIDQKDDNYRNFLKRFNVTYLTARDPEKKIADTYRIYRYPESYLIDKSGKVVQKLVGVDWSPAQLARDIKALL